MGTPLPTIGMDSVKLGFNLKALAQRLVKSTAILFSIDPSDGSLTYEADSERLISVGAGGECELPHVRALICRYTTVVVAKIHADVTELNPNVESDWSVTSERSGDATAGDVAKHIEHLCGQLLEIADEGIAPLLVQLDQHLSQHAALCHPQWTSLYKRVQDWES